MAKYNLLGGIASQTGIYTRSLLFFLIIGLAAATVVIYRPLSALDVPIDQSSGTKPYDFELTLTNKGELFLANSRLDSQVTTSDQLTTFRAQVIDHPQNYITKITIALHLPTPVDESAVAPSMINNGGALSTSSQLIDPQLIVFTAEEVSPQSQLAIQLELPKNYFKRTGITALKEFVDKLPPVTWPAISVSLPALTGLLLLMLSLGRNRRVPVAPGKPTNAPSRLTPAYLGILLKGHISSRELAATFLDLARRGHLVIRQSSSTEFRFSRKSSADKLESFEREMLDQIFGPSSGQSSSEEITFAIAQELFSRRISESFILAYKHINELGYFYKNPLSLHRRYQAAGIILFIIGLVGIVANLFLFPDLRVFLLFWAGMIVSSLLVGKFAKSLPMRTVFGDQELSRWLAFRTYLTSRDSISITAQSQDKYLTYLPYAIIFDCEVEWTKRFYDLPFVQPNWYVAPGISTIDQFANKVFPLFGYLSHLLLLSAQPTSR